MDVLENYTKHPRITEEDTKAYIERLANELRISHDCKLSEEDGCEACREIGAAEDMALTGLTRLETLMEKVDAKTEGEIEQGQLEAN